MKYKRNSTITKRTRNKKNADYYFCFSNSKLKFVISSFQDEIENKEDNQDYRMYRQFKLKD